MMPNEPGWLVNGGEGMYRFLVNRSVEPAYTCGTCLSFLMGELAVECDEQTMQIGNRAPHARPFETVTSLRVFHNCQTSVQK
jgi:hypothetical protein